MRKNILLGLLLLSATIQAQNVGIGINTPAASAKLDVTSTNSGVLIPRVALTMTTAAGPVAAPATSLMVYNTATVADVTPGFYYWDGVKWMRFDDRTTAWNLLGNSGTTAGTNFIGTTDAQAFVIKTNGSAAANERMRILSGGTGVYNNATPFAGDVFSVYGTGYAGATNALGTFALNGYVGASGVAVYGESNSAAANDGIGVYGNLLGTATATGTVSYGVYGENSTTPAGTGIGIGVGGLSTSTTGNGRGVNGSSASPNGIGVAGFNSAVTGGAYGVYGQTSSVAGVGVIGFNLATTGAGAYGVYGQTASTTGIGTVGVATTATGANIGVLGQTVSTAGTGIYGINGVAAITTTTIMGVYGQANGGAGLTTGFSIGTRGNSTATAGANSYGLYGQTSSTAGTGGIAFATSSAAGLQGQNAGTGDGVRGFNTNATPANAGSGVYGQTNATTAMGGEFVNGNALGTGLLAVGNNIGGQYLPRGSGVVGTGVQFGVVGIATTAVNTNPLNNAPISAANASSGGYFEVQSAGIGTAVAWSYVAVREVAGAGGLRKIIGNGTVNTIVKDLKGDYVALSCPETPENLFQDFGQGQLVNGKAHITIDPIFAKNIVVNEKHPLRVFIQLEGDCEGVFVTNKTQNGFDVTELKGGTSNVTFSYTIAANRADELLSDGTTAKYSEERFAPAPGPQATIQAKTIDSRTDAIKTPLVTEPVNTLPSIDKLPNATETKKTKEHIKLTSN